MKKLFNVNGGKLCAFCKYWYDPTNSAITPKNMKTGFWEYEHTQESRCKLTNLPKPSWAKCSDYECKV